jgi:hypothetical protein
MIREKNVCVSIEGSVASPGRYFRLSGKLARVALDLSLICLPTCEFWQYREVIRTSLTKVDLSGLSHLYSKQFQIASRIYKPACSVL